MTPYTTYKSPSSGYKTESNPAYWTQVGGLRTRRVCDNGQYTIDVELTPTGFAGALNTDYKNMFAGVLPGYFVTRYISGISVATISDTEQTITLTIIGTGQDGASVEYSIDDGYSWTVKGTTVNNTFSATGLTSGTLYLWRARLYKGSNFGSYSDEVEKRTSITTLLSDGNTFAIYDSTDLTTLTKDAGTGAVSRWNDKLASGRDFVQATSTRQPIWSSTGILFDGAASNGDFMNMSGVSFDQPEVFYMVVKQVSWTNLDTLVSSGVSNVMRIYQNGSTPQINIRSTTISGNVNDFKVGTTHLLRIAFNGATSHVKVDFINSWQGDAGSTNGITVLVLGAGYNNAANSNIEVKEIIARKIVDNAADEIKIHGYLNDKYAVHSGVWKRYGTVLEITAGSDNDKNVYESNVLYEGNAQILTGTVFKIWYSSGFAGADLAYAESYDGITWVQYASNPLLADSRCNDIIKVGSTYHLYNTNTTTTAFNHYTSTDGITWSLVDANILVKGAAVSWDDTYIANKSIIIENGTWYMFYDGYHTGTGYYQTGLATSADGNIWVKQGANPIINVGSGVSGPCVRKVGNDFYYWGHGHPTGALPTDMISRYKSSDLINWTADTSTFIYTRQLADEGVFNALGQVADIYLIEVNGRTYMFYSATANGGAATGHLHIKLAIANMTIAELVTTQEGNKL